MPSLLSDDLVTLLKYEINRHALPKSFISSVQTHLLAIAESIHNTKKRLNKPIIISFNGAQGSGKSTLTHFISLLLKHHFNSVSLALSIDDFYLSKAERQQLAKKKHPLLKTRGVPGTHDISLAVKTLNHLQICSKNNPCSIPQFNKATDDRIDSFLWINVEKPVDIILFEGWCNHAPTQTDEELMQPLNDLELKHDAGLTWRTYVNQQLNNYHQQLFSLCDQLYFIKIPDFKKVREWRGLQEIKLALQEPQREVMSEDEILKFIQHFERITQHCLTALPHKANCVIQLDNDHNILNLIFKTKI